MKLHILLISLYLFGCCIPNGEKAEIKMPLFYRSPGIDEYIPEIENEEYQIPENCLHDYYANLSDNMGADEYYMGSCGYVAISMLLSYYDTFYDDNFLPEQYDSVSTSFSNSPGIRHSNYNYGFGNANDFYNILLQESSTHFESFLICYENNLRGFYNQHRAPTWCALDDNQAGIILEDYNSYNQNIDYVVVTKDKTNCSTFEAFLLQQLNLKRPVLVGFHLGNGGDYFAVVYDHLFDEESNNYEFYANYGFYQSVSDRHRIVYSNDIVEAYAIEMKSNYTQSNNYIINGVTCNGIELNLANIDYLKHSHSYTYSYVDYSTNFHRMACYCGAIKSTNYKHSYLLGYPDENVCRLCGHIR